jgi:predicted dehydrogenase
MTQSKIAVGLVGYGYWGPNLVRNFRTSDLYDLRWIADLSEKRREIAQKENPGTRVVSDYREILRDSDIELIAIATPPQTHFELGKESLIAGKHVFVEKPISDSVKNAEELVRLAKTHNRVLAVDHPFLYSSSIRKLKHMMDSGELGDIFFVDSERFNLGLIQRDVNVFWDLAVHDIYILDYLFGGKLPVSVYADGERYTQDHQYEYGFLSLRYPEKRVAHIRVSWLSPIKTRRMMVVGSKKMAYYDDVHPDEKLKIIDKGIEYDEKKDMPLSPTYRWGDVVIPRIDTTEALFRELSELYGVIRENKSFPSLGEDGIRVLKVLHASNESLSERKEIRLI